MPEFTMPSLGADMDEGTLTEWLVHEGDRVARGDVVAVVETAKSAIEVECFDAGTITRLLVEPGRTVPVGTPLAVIETSGEPSPEPSTPAVASLPAGEPSKPGGSPPPEHDRRTAAEAESPLSRGTSPIGTSPLVRHMADELGVPLAALHGSGPGGRVTRADVREAADYAREGTAAHERPAASPLARRLARELEVDLRAVNGSGRHGTIKADDVRAAAREKDSPVSVGRATAAAPATPVRGRPGTMRTAIAALMSRAKREIPHYYLSTTIDLAGAVDWVRAYNRGRPVAEHVVPAALLLKATAVAAGRVPELNGFWIDDRFVPGPTVRLGVAISLRGGGLVAPALEEADRMPLPELMAALREVVERARAGRLRSTQSADPTITVTNLGEQGAEAVFGVIYPPQVALVGFGRVTERPVAVDGLLGVHPTVTASLSADHRATDGATGSRFLTAVDRLLKHPEAL
ncbi:dihydrolipoamide acetyltransferase family protein [Embleya sp. NPDC050154]|uniref:dihydrolipoamide acetyltransferase family protein n=1 Tax=Embleya sp. NPDC050154 TaxID=3363988 RepID=UPI0037AA66DE